MLRALALELQGVGKSFLMCADEVGKSLVIQQAVSILVYLCIARSEALRRVEAPTCDPLDDIPV